MGVTNNLLDNSMNQVCATIGRKSQRNADKALRFESEMFEYASRYLVLFLTLNYKPEYRESISLDDILRDRSNLFHNAQSNAFLRGIQGYVCKVEEGTRAGGLHLHLLIFYAGTSRSDVQIAQSIGEYWCSVVTGGRGSYWNSNANKDFHARSGWGVGTGQINRNDLVAREALRNTLLYMAKSEQAVDTSAMPRARLFTTSQASKRGSGRRCATSTTC